MSLNKLAAKGCYFDFEDRQYLDILTYFVYMLTHYFKSTVYHIVQ